jgi:hypothetical protein
MQPWNALAAAVDPDLNDRAELTDPVTLAAHLDPHGYHVRPHLQIMGREIAALEAGRFDRLLLNTPPQVSKSTTAVEWGAFWWLTQHPTARIVIGSYGDDLAIRRGRNIRKLVERHGAVYGLHLEAGSRRAHDWTLVSGGGVRSVGIGSGITGFDADVILIDDPVRSRKDADSQVKRDDTHGWYSADLLSRQQPGLRVLLVQTPWHPDDLRARVLQEEGDQANGGRWRVVVMPALCTNPTTDPLGRLEGEPLPHPKIPAGDTQALLKHWLNIRGSVATRDWQALWQCDPKPPEGALLSWQILRQRRCFERSECAPAQTVAVSIDPSGGGRDTAGIIGGYLGTDGRLYWTHDRSGVMPSDQWARAACELARETEADRFVVETNYGGDMATLALRTAWDALRREQPDRFSVFCPRIVVVRARRGKLLRAEPIAAQVVEDRIRLAAYLPDLESEWATWQVGMDSPGRIDASVHMAYELLPVPSSGDASMIGAQLLSEVSLTGWRT